MGAWHSPGSIFHLGHRAIKDLFNEEVQLQEKIDGSFFAFGLFPGAGDTNFSDANAPLELKMRSKGAMMYAGAPPDMFKPAADTVTKIQHLLKPGWQYRGETLCKPKHNALAYDRVPKGNVILFDIATDEETYLPYAELKAEGDRLGLEVVPQLFVGRITEATELRKFLENTSILGGQKIEGIVAKPLTPIYGTDKKLLMAKLVSEAYKEVHAAAWGESNPTSGDILQRLAVKYTTQTRWDKAIIHLREKGILEDSPRDIPLLMAEVPDDVEKECQDLIKTDLYKWAWPHLRRMLIRKLPEYYKEKLMERQFTIDISS